ncbi:MAG TPA: glycerol-3-phosphate 1-O-acyltransferase PlsY [Gemmatimonadaceae bacterium]|jgi:acyl-phosphate glycerol 3-phosphate acyltransferase
MPPILGALIAYLLGGIPAAYIAGRLVRGIDIREHGSGNLGATNVYRVLGMKVAAPVMGFDILKGALPVLVLPRFVATPQPALWALLYGLLAIIGHVRSPYLRWRSGGKGVATGLGVFLALATLPTLAALGLWGIVFRISGFVSLASLSAAVALPLAIALLDGIRAPVFGLSLVVSLFVFWTHRDNIGRLRRGEERRAGHETPAT